MSNRESALLATLATLLRERARFASVSILTPCDLADMLDAALKGAGDERERQPTQPDERPMLGGWHLRGDFDLVRRDASNRVMVEVVKRQDFHLWRIWNDTGMVAHSTVPDPDLESAKRAADAVAAKWYRLPEDAASPPQSVGDPRSTCPLDEYDCGDSRCTVHHRECNQDGSQCWHDRKPVPAGNERATCCETGARLIQRVDGIPPLFYMRAPDSDALDSRPASTRLHSVVACPFCGVRLRLDHDGPAAPYRPAGKAPEPQPDPPLELDPNADRPDCADGKHQPWCRKYVPQPEAWSSQRDLDDLDDAIVADRARGDRSKAPYNEVSAGKGDVGDVEWSLRWLAGRTSDDTDTGTVLAGTRSLRRIRATVEQLARERDGYRVALDDARDGLDPVLLCAWADGEKECAASACTGTALCPRHVGSAIERLRADLARQPDRLRYISTDELAALIDEVRASRAPGCPICGDGNPREWNGDRDEHGRPKLSDVDRARDLLGCILHGKLAAAAEHIAHLAKPTSTLVGAVVRLLQTRPAGEGWTLRWWRWVDKAHEIGAADDAEARLREALGTSEGT